MATTPISILLCLYVLELPYLPNLCKISENCDRDKPNWEMLAIWLPHFRDFYILVTPGFKLLSLLLAIKTIATLVVFGMNEITGYGSRLRI
jgi:hypothetical protein